MKLIRRNIAQIIALCKKHKVRELCVFGSALTDRFNKDSDVDFTVVFDKSAVGDYFTNYFDSIRPTPSVVKVGFCVTDHDH